jgi:hypothetical protein
MRLRAVTTVPSPSTGVQPNNVYIYTVLCKHMQSFWIKQKYGDGWPHVVKSMFPYLCQIKLQLFKWSFYTKLTKQHNKYIDKYINIKRHEPH